VIKIVRLVAQNVGMIYDRNEILFRDGKILVDGKNGSGKSTIRRLIKYALTEKSDSAIENRFTNKDHRISLYLQDSINKYEIHHFKKLKDFKGKDAYLNEFKTRNDDIIYLKNGINFSMSNDKKATLRQFQNDISFNENVFEYVNLMGCDSKYLPELTDGEIKKKFDEIITVFDDINNFHEKSGKLYVEYNNKYQDYIEKHKQLENAFKIYKDQEAEKLLYIEQETERLRGLVKENKNKQAELNSLNIGYMEEINKLNDKIKVHAKEIDRLSIEYSDKQLILEEKNDELNKIYTEKFVNPKSIELSILQNNLKKKTEELQIIQNKLKYEVTNKKDILNAEISKPICPTCGQKLSVKVQEETLKELLEKEKVLLIEENKLVTEENEAEYLLEQLQEEISDLKNLFDNEKQNKVNSIRSEINNISSEVNTLKDKTYLEKLLIKEIENEVNKFKSKIKENNLLLESLKNIDQSVLDVQHRDLETIKENIKVVHEKMTKTETYKERYSNLLLHITWIHDVLLANKGLKTVILQNLASKMTNIANETFQKYFGSDIEIRINTHRELAKKDKETGLPELKECYNIVAVNKKGADSFAGLSTGEKQMANACCIEAFGSLSRTFGKVSLDFIYADETFNGLKGLNIERMINYIDAKHFTTKLVTSHNDEVKEYFDNILLVEKTSKGSVYNFI
jgi:DNA repair exonuclease SbcCD ATPase subunit